jgi:SAM-dependent methyltransferase
MPEAPDLDDVAARALVRDGYDAIAERYLRLAAAAPVDHPRRERVAALLATLPPASTVLELGCGAGLPVAAEVLRHGHTYFGIDVSPRQIELATRLVPGGDFRCGDLLDQSLDNATFDAVIALYTVTHVPRDEWARLFARVRRWLKPGGRFLVNVPHGDSPGWLEEDFLGLGVTSWTNAFSAETTQGMLEAAGLDVLEAISRPDDDSSPNGWVWITAGR